MISTIEQIHARCERKPNGCIEYPQGKHRYGVLVSIFGKMTVARTVASFKVGERLQSGLEPCHKCDNPRCANPEHIEIGTHRFNMDDKKAKGRSRKGLKLSRETVWKILKRRAAGDLIETIAAQFNLHYVSVGYICTGKRHHKIWEEFRRQLDGEFAAHNQLEAI